jgi:hypothetical protein
MEIRNGLRRDYDENTDQLRPTIRAVWGSPAITLLIVALALSDTRAGAGPTTRT